MSRGSVYALNAGLKKGLALFWTAFLLAMLLTQYLAVATPTKTLAANATGSKLMGGFEVDGDFQGHNSVNGVDWANDANSGAGLVNGPTVQDPMTHDPTVLSNGVSDSDPLTDWQMNGSAQPGTKADIGNVYAVNRVYGSNQWAYIGIERQDGSGTVQYDLEFNKLGNTKNGNGVSVPNRTTGDQLFTATVQGSGAWTINATVQYWTGTWNSGSWSAPTPISASLFYGLSNDAAVTHPSGWADELGSTIPINQFAEMAMNVSAIAANFIGCPGYGTLNIRSISSQGGTPELKDVVAPIPLDLSTCGSLSWQKQDGSGHALGGATFTVTPDPATGTGSVDVTDNKAPDQNATAGSFKLTDVIPGITYTIKEKTAPAGYVLDPTVKTVHVDQYENASADYTWVDPAKVAPTIATTSSVSTADFGTKVHDDATLTGTQALGAPSGSVQFYLCGPNATVPNCATGGTAVGQPVSVDTSGSGGTATSPDYTVGVTAADSGNYCWRAEYTPDSASNYLAGKHTDAKSECFYVAPATIALAKTADDKAVGPGDPVGYTVTVSNTGGNTALGVTVTDNLPTNAGLAWTLGTADAGWTLNGTTLTFSGSLASGAHASAHITSPTTAATCGTISNSASAASTSDGTADVGPVSIMVQCPALHLDKVANPTTYNAVGQTITYTYTLTNSGNVTLSAPYAVSDDKATVTCPSTPATLAPGATVGCSATYTITQADLDAGSVTNHATATARFGESTVTSNQAQATVTASQTPHLSITKTSDQTGYSRVGDVLHYTVVATNDGNVTLHDVVVTDAQVSDLSCAPALPVASLAPGDTIDCTASHTVTQADLDAGHFLNTACVAATGLDATCADKDIPGTQTPHLSITKTSDQTGYSRVGDVLHYTVVATNDGNVTLHDVVVTDAQVSDLSCAPALPVASLAPGDTIDCTASHTVTQADLDAGHFLNTACVAATGLDATCADKDIPGTQTPALHLDKAASPTTYAAVGQTISYSYTLTNTGNVTLSAPYAVSDDKTTATCPSTPATLAPGATVGCSATYTITQADLDAGSVTNHATATARFGESTVTSNQAQATVTAVKTGSLALVKAANPVTYDHVGQKITYTYILTNQANVTLYAPYAVSDDKTSVTCPSTPASLAPGASVSCTASYTITQADLDAGSVTNHATATAKDAEGGTVTSNEAQATVDAVQSPALHLDKAANPTTYVKVGDVIAYTYTLTNSGNVTLSAPYAVSDDHITGLNSVTCPSTPATLAPGASVSCTASYVITQADVVAGSVTNHATATAVFGESTVTSNEAQATVTLTHQPGIHIVKTPSVTVTPTGGGPVTYTYTVTNTGNVPLSGVTVTDDKCAPVSYVSGDANSNELLDPSETWTFTCTSTLKATTTNVATATGHDGETTVTSTDTATVAVPTPTPSGSVLEATGTPVVTPPATSTIDGQGPANGSSSGLLLILMAVGVVALLLGLAAPRPATSRQRNRRS